jgi:hypothetical protein
MAFSGTIRAKLLTSHFHRRKCVGVLITLWEHKEKIALFQQSFSPSGKRNTQQAGSHSCHKTASKIPEKYFQFTFPEFRK